MKYSQNYQYASMPHPHQQQPSHAAGNDIIITFSQNVDNTVFRYNVLLTASNIGEIAEMTKRASSANVMASKRRDKRIDVRGWWAAVETAHKSAARHGNTVRTAPRLN